MDGLSKLQADIAQLRDDLVTLKTLKATAKDHPHPETAALADQIAALQARTTAQFHCLSLAANKLKSLENSLVEFSLKTNDRLLTYDTARKLTFDEILGHAAHLAYSATPRPFWQPGEQTGAWLYYHPSNFEITNSKLLCLQKHGLDACLANPPAAAPGTSSDSQPSLKEEPHIPANSQPEGPKPLSQALSNDLLDLDLDHDHKLGPVLDPENEDVEDVDFFSD